MPRKRAAAAAARVASAWNYAENRATKSVEWKVQENLMQKLAIENTNRIPKEMLETERDKCK